MRRLALLALLLLAPSAQAGPRALGPSESLALADGAAYVAHAGEEAVKVTRVPLDGGPRTVLLDLVVPREPPALARTIRIAIRCLNAADGICRGALDGKGIASKRYAVRAGSRKRITVRVGREAYRALRRERVPVLRLTTPVERLFQLAR